MSLVHGHVLRLNINRFTLHRAPDGIAKLNHPRLLNHIRFDQLGDQDAIVSSGLDMNQTLHVLYGLLIDLGIPERNAHVVSLGFTVREHNRIVEERPQILGLDVREEDVGVDSENDAKAKTFPSYRVNDT